VNVREFALITFSILAQMSVGSLLVLQVVRFFAARKAGEAQADKLTDRAMLVIWPVLGLAMLASLLHLGSPLGAYRAVINVGSSWLSREILLTVLFGVAGVGFAWMQWRKVGTPAVRNAVAWIAVVIGLVLVYAMASVYMIPTAPSWNTVATPIAFFTTALLLGALAMGAAFVANYAYLQRKDPSCVAAQCELLRGTVRWIALVSVLLLGVEFVVAPLQIAILAGGEAAAAASVAMMVGQFGWIFGVRLALIFIGSGVLALFLYQRAQTAGKENSLSGLVYGAFALVLVSEVMGRFIFYATHVRVGL
jgi:anaerobic dimethyl sulfoxide reductase subunit C (anchor subunit)